VTTPEDTEQRPPEAEWVTIPEPPAENRSEPDASDEDRGRPLGAWVLGGGIAAALGGVGLFQAFGTTGLAAGAVTAAGGGAVYGYHKVRGGRSPLDRAAKRARRTSGRALSGGKKGSPKLGIGKGKGPKLGGGKGPKLGGKGGPKLGKGGGPKLGGKSSKLLSGKGAKLGGGKSGRLGGKSGKLFGGRGSKLGGKLGRKATSRLGSVGKSGGKLLGRGGKAGLGKGARGGKLLGGKGKAGVGRWGKSTGGGAGILGRGVRKASRKAGAAAGRTRAGRGFKAARSAMTGKAAGGSRWSRFKGASKAARSTMRSSRNPFARWAASIAAALLALTAMGHDKWKKRQAQNAPPAGTQTNGESADNDTTPTSTPEPNDSGVINPTRIHQRRTMTAFPLAAGAAEMNAAAAAHAPQSMLQVANELDQFGEVPTQVALAVRTYTMRLESDYPIHPAVVEKIQEYAIAEAQMKSLADEIGPLFRQCHAKDLERFEAPRTNEQAWDVSSV
jgi:hypothetical protein